MNQIDKARVAADKANVAALQVAVDMYEFERKGEGHGPLEQGIANGNQKYITQLIAKGYLQKPVESPVSYTHLDVYKRQPMPCAAYCGRIPM